MEILNNLAQGFTVAFALDNLMWAAFGVFMGNLIGVLPGMGVLAAISILLPLTYTMTPTAALVMLSGIYYGSQYGGGITSIMLNLPGTASHAVACLDGNPLARNGKAGSALFMLMFSSFCGASVGILAMILFSPMLVDIAFKFGPAEYFSMMMLGLLAGATLAKGSALKGVAMVTVGLLLGVVGTDVNTGTMRFHFGILELSDGLQIVALAMGLFGVADFLKNINQIGDGAAINTGKIGLSSMRPQPGDIKQSRGALVRGTAIGAAFGILPGTGPTIASFISYATEKKVAREPQRFGRGAIEGIAGPEAATSASTQTGFIPTMSLGIPGDPVMALMLGALIIHGIQPGPQMMIEHADMFWGLIASFWVGNVLLLLLNLPLIGMWVRLLSVPFRYLFPAALFFVCVGVYSTNNNLFDVGMVTFFGIAGYLLMRLRFEPAPLLLGFVLGPMVEENFRRALLLSRGDLAVFVTRPISLGFVIACVALILLLVVSAVRQRTHQKALALQH
ncbi:tripartite tricarboxylate transporter permease [Bordetella avium]|uniref:tripartite tricarboxylate transporter permease n=1 Tax=Bordetella avium TaxID=521 RepID=UPI000E0BACAA|nr:tripartite tricarboxylate transporter permease [Bordetella avium]RIQ12360.1 tripartite tricarboxylate transporter permease [Bordetella avium]RIQ51881.1 tripartite tricarboxylate transporter permease [Bordetella avium]RIQ60300.1 tripartite tricarboxylate transporter permease [Bordetella avium]RIQ60619.1 tripartite tricarboxylate transporter permease [Bordetella avium]RIQ79701.1 tripartite tricarboxylate transporter permease [Bordetella avium]